MNTYTAFSTVYDYLLKHVDYEYCKDEYIYNSENNIERFLRTSTNEGGEIYK